MREQTIEVEEREVERVYCDECGDDCTDDFQIEPSEVCQSCSSETAVDRVADLMEFDGDDGKPLLEVEVIILILIFPIVGGMIFLSGLGRDGPSSADFRLMIMLIFGSVLWTALFCTIAFL